MLDTQFVLLPYLHTCSSSLDLRFWPSADSKGSEAPSPATTEIHLKPPGLPFAHPMKTLIRTILTPSKVGP
jgi:hypothetical protein